MAPPRLHADQYIRSLRPDGRGGAAGKQHDDARDSTRVGHRRFPLALTWQFEVHGKTMDFWMMGHKAAHPESKGGPQRRHVLKAEGGSQGGTS